MINLSPRNEKALNEVSARLGISSRKLWALIQFESRFNPFIKNPYSSARGLIQFTDSTAQRLGYKNSYDLVTRHPSIESQLRTPVYNYLKQFKPFPTDQALFMSVFYPKARYWPSFKLFPYQVRKVNPGINTPADYVRKVYRRTNLTYFPPILFLLGIGAILYITYKRGGFKWPKKPGQQITEKEREAEAIPARI